MNIDILARHFARMGARVLCRLEGREPTAAASIDVRRDRRGEFFDIRCAEALVPQVIQVVPRERHLVLMARDGRSKNKFLCGHDERHWFVAAIPSPTVTTVAAAIRDLRPTELSSVRGVIRQGEWFFEPAPGLDERGSLVFRKEPLSRGAGSKPHMCEESMRRGGIAVMVSSRHPLGISLDEYQLLVMEDPKELHQNWRRMTRDAKVYVRGKVRHSDHQTVRLDGWHRVYMNRERFAAHAAQVAFLD
jgi:hypothetical protein